MDKPENRIIVVDDDPFAAELMGVILESEGFEVILAEGGVDALEKIAVDPYIKIIVSDMNMPFLTGVQLFEELRHNGFSQPFLLLTAEDPAVLRSLHPEIDAVLAKDEEVQETLPALIKAFFTKIEAKETR
jgi:CheY-like chemotaxis protein